MVGTCIARALAVPQLIVEVVDALKMRTVRVGALLAVHVVAAVCVYVAPLAPRTPFTPVEDVVPLESTCPKSKVVPTMSNWKIPTFWAVTEIESFAGCAKALPAAARNRNTPTANSLFLIYVSFPCLPLTFVADA